MKNRDDCPTRAGLCGSKLNEQAKTGDCCSDLSRRSFVKTVGLSSVLATSATAKAVAPRSPGVGKLPFSAQLDKSWPTFKRYGPRKLDRIAMPIGGIGTGSVSLGGRGDLRDWEIMNRPAKGFVPKNGESSPSLILYTETQGGKRDTRLMEGPLEISEYEGSHGSTSPNENLPRFRNCSFDSAYPFGRVVLQDPEVPVEIQIKAFNPLVPADVPTSSIPVAILLVEAHNPTPDPVTFSICATLPNFIGIDGYQTDRDWKGDVFPVGASKNKNTFRQTSICTGIMMSTEGVDPKASQWGTLALATPSSAFLTHRTCWAKQRWGNSWLDFWDDFSFDGKLDSRPDSGSDTPTASLAVMSTLPPGTSMEIPFLIGWHFPNRYTWTPKENRLGGEDLIGNYYTTQYSDAWEVVEQVSPIIDKLRLQSAEFVSTFLGSTLPEEVKESALFNISTLRTQTCFRTPDGRFFGFEGTADHKGCCHGSCTHVWNYEQATAFLFGSLALSMREVEFKYATDEAGLMSFRVNLPLSRAQDSRKAAADGQMGCIMKMYRDWQLSGNDKLLKSLWPHVRRALEFSWIEGGWDADRDGVMEGCQHNTMDVEYYGPNPQMGIWYLGALRALEEMSRYLGDEDLAEECHRLFAQGRDWIDRNLFNGEFYEHQIQPPLDRSGIAPSLLIGMGSADPAHPEFQLGAGCLVDQLVGQFVAHVTGLGYLVDPQHVRSTLVSIRKYNRRQSLHDHFNCMRTFAMEDEPALLMASYPKERPTFPFPYFTEVMTGFEYTAAIGMLYEGMLDDGLESIRDIRARYDGLKRNPFNEAECGNHYARAMASWAAVLALSGFHYSAPNRSITFAPSEGTFFWSNGYAWGNCSLHKDVAAMRVSLNVRYGELDLDQCVLTNFGVHRFGTAGLIRAGHSASFLVQRG